MNHNLFDKGVIACAKWFRKVSWVALVFMLLISIVDIAGSKLFGKPLLGSYDLISLSALILAAFAISHAEVLGQHVRVDFVLMRLPPRVQDFLAVISSFLCIGVSLLFVISAYKYAVSLRSSHEVSTTILIPYFPFQVLNVVCFILFTCVFISEFIKALRKLGGKEE